MPAVSHALVFKFLFTYIILSVASVPFTRFLPPFAENRLATVMWHNIFTPDLKIDAMDNNVNSENNIFTYAFIGAVLFSAAIGFTFFALSGIPGVELSYMIVAGILGFSSIFLLYKAIKSDQQRIKWKD
jgi:hypothetical protein